MLIYPRFYSRSWIRLGSCGRITAMAIAGRNHAIIAAQFAGASNLGAGSVDESDHRPAGGSGGLLQAVQGRGWRRVPLRFSGVLRAVVMIEP